MPTPRFDALTLEYLRVPISAKEAGVAVNPTSDTVKMAFVPKGTKPVNGDWKVASWETDGSTIPATYLARCLVGPGGTVQLAAGTYVVWVQVTDAPEIPIRDAGELIIV
jgi:hypothetical protein